MNSIYAQNNNLWDQLDVSPATVSASGGTPSFVTNNNLTSTTSTLSTDWNTVFTNNSYLQADFGSSGRLITGFSISSPTTVGNAPRDFTLRGSTDGSNWTILFTRSGAWPANFSRQGETRIFSFTNATSYRYYRLYITETQNTTSGTVALNEWQLFKTVGLSGYVFKDNGDKVYGKGSGDAGIAGVQVSIVAENGTVAATATTNSDGLYTFNATTLSYPSLNGDFSVVVTPPSGYTFASELLQPYTQYTISTHGLNLTRSAPAREDGSFAFLSISSVPRAGVIYNNRSRFDYGQNITRSGGGYTQTVNLARESLDFGLLPATGANFTSFYPPGYVALPNNLVTVDVNGTSGEYPVAQYSVNHPTTPAFNIDAPNNNFYIPFNGAGSTYSFKNNPGYDEGLGATGVVIQEGTYTVTNFLGTLQADITGKVSSGSGNISTNPARPQESLINAYEGGWRKTYGSTTGDVYDRFIAANGINGSTNALFTSNSFSLIAGRPYAIFFSGKNANSSTQSGTPSQATVAIQVLDASNAIVANGSVTLAAPIASGNTPTSAWESKYFQYTPTTSGSYKTVIRATTTAQFGNDYYIDNIGTYELRPLITISGTVWNDVDNSANDTFTNIRTGSEVPAAASDMFAYLVNSDGVIQDISAVNPATGTYSFTNAPGNSSGLSVVLSTTTGLAIGDIPPAGNVPSGWVNTTPLTQTTFNTATVNITGKDFGIQVPPTAVSNTLSNQINPGGSNSFSISGTNFEGSDVDGGVVTSITITTFPSNTESLTINGITYTSANFPASGVNIPTDAIGNPTQSIAVNPVDGNVNVMIPYSATDNGSAKSTEATVTVPFITLTISGNIFNDGNGAEDATVNSSGDSPLSPVDGTNLNGLQGPLYISLISGSNIIATVPVSDTGTYSFEQVTPGTYSTILTTNPAGSTAPSLPSGWNNTGEQLGITTGGQQAPADGILTDIVVGNTDVTNANFGINNKPVVTDETADEKVNPGGTVISSVTFPTGQGYSASDVEDDYATFVTGEIVTLYPATDGNLYYDANGNGIADADELISTVTTVPNFDPTKVYVDPTAPSGPATVTFDYAITDEAGIISDPQTVTVPFSSSLPVSLASFTAKKGESNSVVLKWTTTEESHSDRFDIQFSTDGKNWTVTGSIPANVETKTLSIYNFIHTTPVNGQNLYRLKMVDLDQTFTLSSIVGLTINEPLDISFYPNPAVNTIQVRMNGSGSIADIRSVKIYDLNGKSIYSATKLVQNQIHVDHILAGTYVLSITLNDGTQRHEKIIIIK